MNDSYLRAGVVLAYLTALVSFSSGSGWRHEAREGRRKGGTRDYLL